MRGPLSVRIVTETEDKHVTRYVRDARFKRSAFGGDVDFSCTLLVPRGYFNDLGAGADLLLYDTRTCGVVWQGTIDNPGASSGMGGDSYAIHAFGGATGLQGIRKPLAPVYQADDGWRRTDSTKGAHTDTDEKADGTPTLEVSWEKRFELETNDQGVWALRVFQSAGLDIGRFRADVDAGVTDGDFSMRLLTGNTVGALASAANTTANTTPSTLVATVGGGGITVGDDIAGLRVRYTGADLEVTADTGSGGVTGDADLGTGDVTGSADTGTGETTGGVPTKHYWFRFWDVIVCQLLKDKHGDDRTDAGVYSTNTVLASDVIADMVGRNMCRGLDPDKVSIETTTYGIDSLAWLDGITMGDALAELLNYERNLWWTVYGDALTVATWDHDEPRYVISKRDGGITLPGQEITLCNRVLVSWTDRRGREQTTTVTTTVEGLDYTRDAEPISLPEGQGSAANAQRAGEKILELNNDPPRAGTAVVRRPILDLWTGQYVWPHEIQPACVVIERETGDDFRLTDVEYADTDGAAALTLGEPVRTEAQVMARLERKQRRRR